MDVKANVLLVYTNLIYVLPVKLAILFMMLRVTLLAQIFLYQLITFVHNVKRIQLDAFNVKRIIFTNVRPVKKDTKKTLKMDNAKNLIGMTQKFKN